jgi:hypothetical protein
MTKNRQEINEGEPYKWNLNPQACLRELGRMDDDPSYRKTICGVHRILWSVINIDCSGYIPEEYLDKVNELLEIAFLMGKRMDYRLREYHAKTHSMDDAVSHSLSGKFTSKVKFPDPEVKEIAKKKNYRRPDNVIE